MNFTKLDHGIWLIVNLLICQFFFVCVCYDSEKQLRCITPEQ